MAAISTAAAILVTWVTPPTEPARLRAFYQKVEPDGFWATTATAAGVDPRAPRRRLGVALGLTFLTSASVFLTLIGAGRLLVSPPGASAWPSVFLLLVAAALVPTWWGRSVDRAVRLDM